MPYSSCVKWRLSRPFLALDALVVPVVGAVTAVSIAFWTVAAETGEDVAACPSLDPAGKAVVAGLVGVADAADPK